MSISVKLQSPGTASTIFDGLQRKMNQVSEKVNMYHLVQIFDDHVFIFIFINNYSRSWLSAADSQRGRLWVGGRVGGVDNVAVGGVEGRVGGGVGGLDKKIWPYG